MIIVQVFNFGNLGKPGIRWNPNTDSMVKLVSGSQGLENTIALGN